MNSGINRQNTTISITEATGATPLISLKRIGRDRGLRLLVKLESMNPLGSVKDRVAVAMIEAAEETGMLKAGMRVIEPTSGNTGIGLAFVCASRGYALTLTMPESMSLERRKLLAHLGAELVLTPAAEGMRGAVARAEALHQQQLGSWIANQFTNPANPAVHKKHTGPEIWAQCGGVIHFFVSGVGTGGTITGAGGYLKAQDQNIQVVAVEPAASPVLSGGQPGPHGLQGIGAGFVPEVLDRSVIDRIVQVTETSALACARQLAREEGILCGISGGAALAAALELGKDTTHPAAKQKQINEERANKERIVVVIIPDTGERYLSTALLTQ